MKRLLIDGDIIAYKAATSAETPVNWGDGLWTLHCYEDDVRVRIDDQIAKLMEAPVQDHIVGLTDTTNYRKTIAPYYKLNRKKIRKPMLLGWAREYMVENYNTTIWKGLEADDILGILLTTTKVVLKWVLLQLKKFLRKIVRGKLLEMRSRVRGYQKRKP